MAERREYEIVFSREGGFEQRDLPAPPAPGRGEVLVRPAYVGICGSDLFLLEGHSGELRLGHEWVGTVEKAGSSAGGFRPGDVVTSTGTLACFDCGYCAREQTHFCDHAEYLSSDRMGAMRSWMLVRGENLVVVPGKLSQSKVILEVMAVAEEGMRLIRAQLETLPSEMLILGGGPIGAMLALVAKRSGVKPIVVEKREGRCEAVRKLGLECLPLGQALLDPRFSGRFVLIADATSDGYGDLGAFRNLVSFARKGFVGLMVGKYLNPQQLPVAYNRMGARLVWMRGMPQSTLRAAVEKWGAAAEELAAGYVSDVFPADRVKDAFDLAASKSAMKVVVRL